MANRRTSIKLIEKAVTEKWIRQLAFYHLMKYNFNNSCIYNYKSRMNEVAGKLDISTKTLYNNLNFLKSKELIGEHKNNLMLKSIRDFKARKKTILLINGNHSLYDVTCLLYAKLIEQSANHQAYAESIRLYEKRFTKDKKAQNGRGDGFNRGLSENPFRPSLSFRTIAKIINCSEYKAFQVVKNLNRLRVIESEKQKPHKLSSNFTELNSVSDYPGYRYNIGTELFEIFGARLDFLQFPVFLKKISYRQYLKFAKGDSSDILY